MTSVISSIFAFFVHVIFILSLIGCVAFPFVKSSYMGSYMPVSPVGVGLEIVGLLIMDIMIFGVIYVLLDIMQSLRSIKANSSYLAWSRANAQHAPAQNPMPQRRA